MKRISPTFSNEEYTAIQKKAKQEHRTPTGYVYAVVVSSLQMREEWRQTGKINLPKAQKRKDVQDVENMLLNPE